MGSIESRVVDDEAEVAEPYHQKNPNGQAKVRLSVSEALMSQMNNPQQQQQPVEPEPEELEETEPIIEPETKVEEEQPIIDEPIDIIEQPAANTEEEDAEKVREMIQQLNSQQFRGPISVVKCSEEREACFQCYSDNTKSALNCEEVTNAFVECAKDEIKGFVARKS